MSLRRASVCETQLYGHTISNILITDMWPRDTHSHTWFKQLPFPDTRPAVAVNFPQSAIAGTLLWFS